jgi:hypothetical protein
MHEDITQSAFVSLNNDFFVVEDWEHDIKKKKAGNFQPFSKN